MQQNSSPCPDKTLLERLVHGDTDEPSAAAFEAHLQACTRCSETIDSLLDDSDTCVRELARLPLRGEDDANFRELYQNLLSAPEPFGTSIGTTIGAHADANRRLLGEHRAPPPRIDLPHIVSEYELVELLGRGAHGSVYKARHRKLDRLVAIKLLPRRSSDGSTTDPFLDEMRAIGRLDHPNIIRATDAGESGDWYYLAMEYQPGTDISSLVEQKLQHFNEAIPDWHFPLSIANACEIARQTALALQCVSDHQLVHRDVKPSNLLLTKEGQVKLLDLGLVALPPTGDEGDGDAFLPPRGTASYMSPEQWRNYGHVDIRADLYSLGCTLYKLMIGYTPFHDDSINRRHAHCHIRPKRLRELRDDVPESLDRLVQQLLEKSPDDRIQTPGELASLLQPYCSDSDLALILDESADGSRPFAQATDEFDSGSSSRRRFLWGTFGVTVAAVTGLRAWRPRKSSGLRTGPWRTLAPRQPIELLQLHDAVRHGAWNVSARGRGKYRYVGSQPDNADDKDQSVDLQHLPALLNLGQPISGEYALRVEMGEFDQADSDGGIGLFFRFRDSRQERDDEVVGFRFQSIEWCLDENVPTLIWSASSIELHAGSKTNVRRVVLAGIEVPATPDDSTNELLVELGKQGFPRLVWNGEELNESTWTVSFEGRTKSAIPKRLLQGEYRGRVGLIARKMSAVFWDPRLRYLP